MRQFKNGRVPLAHPDAFIDNTSYVAEGPHGADQLIGPCLVWNAARSSKGYGRIWVEGKPVDAHRHAYTLEFGQIPDGLFVLHRCDNPPCVLGEHLFLGTHSDNMKDMAKKKRRSWEGDANPNCRLSDDEIEEIRRRYIPRQNGKQLAREFDVSLPTIMNIIRATSGRYRVAA